MRRYRDPEIHSFRKVTNGLPEHEIPGQFEVTMTITDDRSRAVSPRTIFIMTEPELDQLKDFITNRGWE